MSLVVLRLASASRRFGETWALWPLDLELGRGEGLALLGPNGAGKSTMLSLAAGVLLPTEGRVEVLGRDPGAHPPTRARIGLLPHGSPMEPVETVAEQVRFCHRWRGGGEPNPAAIRDALELADEWERPFGCLSAGFRRRAELAAAVVGGPALLLLDEPLQALDRSLRAQVLGRVRELLPEAAVLLASHVPAETRPLCRRYLALEDGRATGPEPFPPACLRLGLAAGATEEARARELLAGLPSVRHVQPTGEGRLECLLDRPEAAAGAVRALVEAGIDVSRAEEVEHAAEANEPSSRG